MNIKTKISLSVGAFAIAFLVFLVFGGFNYLPDFLFKHGFFNIFNICTGLIALSFTMAMIFDTIKSLRTGSFSLAKLFWYISALMLTILVAFLLFALNSPTSTAPWPWKTTDVIAVYCGIMLLPFTAGLVLYAIKEPKK